MTTLTDKYGRLISVSQADGLDIYSVDGVEFSFTAGWPQEQALSTIEAMQTAPVLADLKRDAAAAVERLFSEKVADGVLHVASGLHVAIDDVSRTNLAGLAATALAAASSLAPWPASYQEGWIAIENQRIPLPAPADALALASTAGDRYAQLRQYARDLKDSIAAAVDESALAAIDLNSGWPI